MDSPDLSDLVDQILEDGNADLVLKDLEGVTGESFDDMKFPPNEGPQTEAYISKADILLYGGEPSGGKTGLLALLAAQEHQRSLIVRARFTDLDGVIDNFKELYGGEGDFVGGSRPKCRIDGRKIDFEGMLQSDGGIDPGKQGVARDFIGVDEVAQLPKEAVMMLLGWNRPLGDNKQQRCRMVLASNPPINTVGDWLGEFFAPWLDEDHPNPAADGELRWYIIDGDQNSVPVDGAGNYLIVDGEPVKVDHPTDETLSALSRTFIRANVKDNPYIDSSSYMARLNAMPEPARSIFLSGNFLHARQDHEWQVIPTEWVKLAQDRWKEHGRQEGVPMCAMGVDIAQGGADKTVLSIRYDGWFDGLLSVPGVDTPDGPSVASLIMKHRRGSPHIVIDMDGGWGGGCKTHLEQNKIPNLVSFKGNAKSMARTSDKALKFVNKRSESWWRLREALDPSQDGGSPIMLPPDKELLSDLCTPLYEIVPNGIKVESKGDGVDAQGNPKPGIKKRLGRSPDRGDAVVMCWNVGLTQANIQGGWKAHNQRVSKPNVVVGHANKKKSRR